MFRVIAALALACALSACNSLRTPQTSATAWGQIAAGVGTIVGETKADPVIAKASDKLGQYCGALQAAAFGVSIFAPEAQRLAARQAAAVVETVCAAPPADLAGALASAARAYAAVQAAR